MTTKPIVHYRELHAELRKGCWATITPLDHPNGFVTNTKPVVTSPIVRIGKFGEFETRNSIYRRVA